mmetsp:Transcript_70516/g.217853  ORF Transcript_70516/g.217853 Transcript_70516/m.217853 type:complete len:248 (+) Transcript_70516:393-1136(+)
MGGPCCGKPHGHQAHDLPRLGPLCARHSGPARRPGGCSCRRRRGRAAGGGRKGTRASGSAATAGQLPGALAFELLDLPLELHSAGDDIWWRRGVDGRGGDEGVPGEAHGADAAQGRPRRLGPRPQDGRHQRLRGRRQPRGLDRHRLPAGWSGRHQGLGHRLRAGSGYCHRRHSLWHSADWPRPYQHARGHARQARAESLGSGARPVGGHRPLCPRAAGRGGGLRRRVPWARRGRRGWQPHCGGLGVL